MKNITNQYKDLKEGKISQANFMRNLRITFPHLVTNVTSFDDSIKILKNKGLLNEDLYGQQIAGNLEKEKASREAFRSPAFNQGSSAHKNGVSLEENPFDENTREGQEWTNGWFYQAEKVKQMYANTDPNLGEPIEPVFESRDMNMWLERFYQELENPSRLANTDPIKVKKALEYLTDEGIIEIYKYFNPESAIGAFLSDVNEWAARLDAGVSYMTDPERGLQENLEYTDNNDVEQAIMDLEMEKNNLLNTDPRYKDPEIISDKIDDINTEIDRLKSKLKGASLGSGWTGLDEDLEEAAMPFITRNDELKKGIEIEMEEHGLSYSIAKQIAIDHLSKDPFYYSKQESGEPTEEDLADFGKYANNIEWEPSEEEYMFEVKGSSSKEQYSNFDELDNLNAQEVLIGIDCEKQMNPELSKKEAAKIVIKNLKKNPYYYTDYKLAGKEAKTEPMYKYKEGSDQMRPVKGESNFIDKDNGMKTPKGVEKIKASAAKASKETNKGVKGVQEMTHNAKSVRGVKKMDSTGGKMKKVKIKESLKSLIKQVIAEELKKNK